MTTCQVLSVNVGQRRIVDWRDQQIETGFYKAPVHGPVTIRGVNLAGDDQADRAVHGGPFKTVYAYPHEHYARWRDELSNSVLDPGSFGENLTLSGLLEEDVACGDILHIGDAALIVTEPRVPCWKLAMRFGRDDMPAVFARRGLTGWYMAVHAEGSLTAGDGITIEHTTEPRITMRQLADLRSRPAEADPATLHAARHLPWLTSEWHDFIERMLARPTSSKPTPPTVRPNVRISSRRSLSPDVVELELAPTTGERLPPAAAGQFVALTVEGRDGRRATRCYTLCGPPDSDRWRVAIKQVPDVDDSSPLISHRMRDLPIGHVLDSAAPAGTFTLDLHEPGRPLVLIGAGIGVTPIISMLRAILADPAPRQDPIIVVHACESPERELYADVFQQAHSTPGITVHTFCLKDGRPSAGHPHAGLLDVDRLMATCSLDVGRLLRLRATRTDDAPARWSTGPGHAHRPLPHRGVRPHGRADQSHLPPRALRSDLRPILLHRPIDRSSRDHPRRGRALRGPDRVVVPQRLLRNLRHRHPRRNRRLPHRAHGTALRQHRPRLPRHSHNERGHRCLRLRAPTKTPCAQRSAQPSKHVRLASSPTEQSSSPPPAS